MGGVFKTVDLLSISKRLNSSKKLFYNRVLVDHTMTQSHRSYCVWFHATQTWENKFIWIELVTLHISSCRVSIMPLRHTEVRKSLIHPSVEQNQLTTMLVLSQLLWAEQILNKSEKLNGKDFLELFRNALRIRSKFVAREQLSEWLNMGVQTLRP